MSNIGDDYDLDAPIDLSHGGKMTYAQCAEKIAALEAAAFDALGILMPLSMGTEGEVRSRICSASNKLRKALGKAQSSHGEKA